MCKKSYMFHIFIVFNIFWLKVNRLKAKKVCHIGMTHFLLIFGRSIHLNEMPLLLVLLDIAAFLRPSAGRTASCR